MGASKEIIIAIISAISGGGLASLVSLRIKLKKHQLEEVKEVLEANRILREELSIKVEKLEEKVEEQIEENKALMKENTRLTIELSECQNAI